MSLKRKQKITLPLRGKYEGSMRGSVYSNRIYRCRVAVDADPPLVRRVGRERKRESKGGQREGLMKKINVLTQNALLRAILARWLSRGSARRRTRTSPFAGSADVRGVHGTADRVHDATDAVDGDRANRSPMPNS